MGGGKKYWETRVRNVWGRKKGGGIEVGGFHRRKCQVFSLKKRKIRGECGGKRGRMKK